MNDDHELFTIGQLSRRTGLPVRAIRFWSDLGLVPPVDRSAGGYRLYDVAAVARLDLLRTLRDLGLDLATTRQVLAHQRSVAEVARMHVRALDAEIRTLRLRRAVLRSVARRSGTTEELRIMNDLARLSARERQQIIDEFVAGTFTGLPADGPGAALAQAMRTLPAELPDDPTDAEVDAWIELAELVGDPAFRQRVREMAVAGAATGGGTGDTAGAGGGDGAAGVDRGTAGGDGTGTRAGTSPVPAFDPGPVLGELRAAVADQVAPDSDAGATMLERVVGAGMSGSDRTRLAEYLATFTDRRVERYWQLIGVLNGRPPFPPSVEAMEWLIAALRAPRS